MILTDNNLAALFAALDPRERKVIEAHISGKESDEAMAILRRLRRRLKRKARRGKRR